MTLGVTPEGRGEEGRGASLLLRGHSHGTYSDRLMKDLRRRKPFVVDSMLGGGCGNLHTGSGALGRVQRTQPGSGRDPGVSGEPRTPACALCSPNSFPLVPALIKAGDGRRELVRPALTAWAPGRGRACD